MGPCPITCVYLVPSAEKGGNGNINPVQLSPSIAEGDNRSPPAYTGFVSFDLTSQ